MSRFAIRLLTLTIFATAVAVVPMLTPAKAATSNTESKKKHKKMSPRSSTFEAPRASTQYPPNMSDDPARKVGGY
jgi:hypothetical protein